MAGYFNLYWDDRAGKMPFILMLGPDKQLALAVNPYHLGFRMWERIVDKQGIEAARKIVRDARDVSLVFVRVEAVAQLAGQARLGILLVWAGETGDHLVVLARGRQSLTELGILLALHLGPLDQGLAGQMVDLQALDAGLVL